VPARKELARGVAYAALFKSLVYAGAAAHFLGKFGGEHHLQRLTYYLNQCETLMGSWRPLRPFARLLAPHFRAAHEAVPRPAAPLRNGPAE
jgi:hypothetical protein